jgi:hypothetical protein
MSTIKVSDLAPAGSNLFSDSESYMRELSEEESMIQGGNPNLLVATATLLGQNYANDEDGWLTKLGNKIGDDWYEAFGPSETLLDIVDFLSGS